MNQTDNEPILQCPRCKVGMRKLRKGNITIDVCDHCDGMWLDKGELQKLEQQRAQK